jgi:hypothetical protein
MSATPANTSFGAKSLRTTFYLGAGSAASFSSGANQLVLTGLRTLANIQGAFNFLTQLDLQVYGMALEDMNALSAISGWQGYPTAIGKNYVLLEGSQDGGTSWFTLFYGVIVEGGPILEGMPETYFHCQAMPAYYLPGKQPIAGGASWPSGATHREVASVYTSAMGAGLQLNGVAGTIPKGAYLAGSPIDMAQKHVQLGGGAFSIVFDPIGTPTGGISGTLALIPKGGSRSIPSGVTLTPTTGLIGFPTIEALGIGVVAYFNPAMLVGSLFTISDSLITPANGSWIPYQQTLQLESLNLGSSNWFARMQCIAAARAA